MIKNSVRFEFGEKPLLMLCILSFPQVKLKAFLPDFLSNLSL